MLGAGGFGNVYKAMHKQFGRVVAIKVLKTTLLDESDGLLRFEREAKSINSIKHRNIISLYGYGIWQNAPYMVMEFIEGKSLDDTLEVQYKLEPEVVLAVMSQLFAGLACAHASGVVHRDLKPSNIMLIPSSESMPSASNELSAVIPSAEIRWVSAITLITRCRISSDISLAKSSEPTRRRSGMCSPGPEGGAGTRRPRRWWR